MKKLRLALLFVSLISLTACDLFGGKGNNGGGGKKENEQVELYDSDDPYQSDAFKLEYSYTPSIWDGASVDINLEVTNLASSQKKFTFANAKVVREGDNVNCAVSTNQATSPTLDANYKHEISYFCSSLKESVRDHNYHFVVDINNVSFKLHLYERPDELRKDCKVSYQIDGKEVHSKTVKEGRLLAETYVYESPLHDTYATIWYDANHLPVTALSVIKDNVVLTGDLTTANSYTVDGDYAYLDAVSYIFSDDVVVVAGTYQGKQVNTIAANVFFQSQAKKVYLPASITDLGTRNFQLCLSLEAIYFAGTQAQWDAVRKVNTDITGVRVVVETPFVPAAA